MNDRNRKDLCFHTEGRGSVSDQLQEKEEQLQKRLKKIAEMEQAIKEREKKLSDKEKARKQVVLRLSPSLWADLAEWAEEDFRSINGQVEYLLAEAVKKRKKQQ